MRRLRFDAWTNGLSETDPGHMGMLDVVGGYYYELAMGTAINWDERETREEDEKLDAMEKGEKYLASLRFPKAVKVTDVMTKVSRTTLTKGLILRREPKSEYFKRQLMKTTPNSTTFRFTNLFYLEVDVDDDEYQCVMLNAFVRGSCGAYNMMKEAQIQHPLTTRCLTLLETLAGLRGIRIKPGTALQVLTDFGGQCGCPIQEDPLIAI